MRIQPRRLAAVAVVGLILALWSSGAWRSLQPEALVSTLQEGGAAGVAVFVSAMALLQPFGVSVYLWLGVASQVWSLPVALVAGWLGATASACVAFGLGRVFARDAVQARLPPWARAWDGRLGRGGFVAALRLRLVFFTTPAVQLAMGLSSLRFAHFLAAVMLANVPWVVFGVLLGRGLGDWLRANPPQGWDARVWAALGASVGIVGVAWVLRRRSGGGPTGDAAGGA